MCVCVEFHHDRVVCVLERDKERWRLSCERQLKVEEEVALRGEAAPTIGIRALLIRGGDDGAGGYGGRRGAGRRLRLRRR